MNKSVACAHAVFVESARAKIHKLSDAKNEQDTIAIGKIKTLDFNHPIS